MGISKVLSTIFLYKIMNNNFCPPDAKSLYVHMYLGSLADK